MPILRWLVIIGFCCNFSMIAVWTMFLLYGTHQLQLASATIGMIFTVSSVGGVIGAMIAGQLMTRFALGPVYFIALTGPFLGPIVIVIAAGPRLVVVGLMILSFFITYLVLVLPDVVVISVRQAVTVPSLMGRMTACFRMLLFGGGTLGGLAAGLLASGLGNKNALIVAAAGSGRRGIPAGPVARYPAP
jgi:MFS family permease